MPRETRPRLPSVERILQSAGDLIDRHGRAAVTDAVRAALKDARPAWRAGTDAPSPQQVLDTAAARLEARSAPSLRPAVNATGVILHTGLGRAALAPAAIEQVRDIAAGHSTLEIDLETGERSSRHDHVAGLLCELTGAEDAMAVNNDAGAVLLALAALARGREVIVSRGELVEIGGGFRVPEVMAESGARLVEVGTTNKTRLSDYERAVTPDTAALLKVHPSNYRIVGFTESTSLPELAALARERGLLLLDDWGSGSLVDLRPLGLGDEPPVSERIRQGADVVMFSGDKLLGGPQAGIIVGRAALVAQMRSHPLARALRCDKLTLAALEATLCVYRRGSAWEDIPTLRAISRPAAEIREHAQSLVDVLNSIDGVRAEVVPSTCRAGAGAMPGEDVPSFAAAVCVDGLGPNALAERLRRNDPPVFVRVTRDMVFVEPRTLLPGEDGLLAEAVRRAASESSTERKES